MRQRTPSLVHCDPISEATVAEECLAAIASVRDPGRALRPAAKLPIPDPPIDEDVADDALETLPEPMRPPRPAPSRIAPESEPSVPRPPSSGVRAFVRTQEKQDSVPALAPSLPAASTAAPTPIVVRERPRTVWLLAAALAGVLGTLVTQDLLARLPSRVAAPSPAASIVRFDDAHGAAIEVTNANVDEPLAMATPTAIVPSAPSSVVAPQTPASSAPKPAAPPSSRPPKLASSPPTNTIVQLPDGTLALPGVSR
jgi:hypothetical protein